MSERENKGDGSGSALPGPSAQNLIPVQACQSFGKFWDGLVRDGIPERHKQTAYAAWLFCKALSKEAPTESPQGEPSQEPHIPTGYMEEATCRTCGKPTDDPIHFWPRQGKGG